jgi:hypothetical protein
MRVFTFLLISLLFSIVAFAQTPTQEETEAQKNEALKDARQQVVDFKKQIAEAKANHEDPDGIKEMEKQLSTLEKMVTVLEGTHLSGNRIPTSLPSSGNSGPAYISPFTPIRVKQPVTTPAKDNAKDQLLWYTGKRVNANTLITPGGMLVQYIPQQNRVIVQPEKKADSNYYGLLTTLASTPRWKSQFALAMSGVMNSFFMWPEIFKAYEEYDLFKTRYYDMARNAFDVPPPEPNVILETWHTRLVNYMAKVASVQNIELPPKRPNDLCDCDADARHNYEDHLAAWLEQDFWKEERQLLNYLEAIYTQGMAINASRPVPANLRPDIVKAYDLIVERCRIKLEKLSNEYINPDIYVEEGLVMATLSLQKMLIHTLGDIDDPSIAVSKKNAWADIQWIKQIIQQNQVFDKYMKDQMAARNYNVVFDYSLYLSHEYNKKLLSPSYAITENFFQNWMEKLRKFNRFTLSINLDFEYAIEDAKGSRGLLADGALESKKIVVSLGRSTCKWHLYISDVNQSGLRRNEDSFYMTMKVLHGTKTIYRDPEEPLVFSYSGPANMAMVFPNFQITFCNTGEPDSVLMDKLRYTDADTKAFMAVHPKPNFGREYSLDMFQYVNKMFVAVIKAKTNSEEMATTAGEMMNMQNMTQLPNSTGNQNLDRLMMEYVMNQKRRSLQQSLTPINNTGNTVIPFNAVNGSSTLISTTQSTIDPNDPDRAYGIKMTRSLVTIKVEHTPL